MEHNHYNGTEAGERKRRKTKKHKDENKKPQVKM